MTPDEAKQNWPWLTKNSQGFANAVSYMDLNNAALKSVINMLEQHKITWEDFSLPVSKSDAKIRIQTQFLWNTALTFTQQHEQARLLEAIKSSPTQWGNSFAARASGVTHIEVALGKGEFGVDVVESCYVYLDPQKTGDRFCLAPLFGSVLESAGVSNLNIERIIGNASAACANPIQQAELPVEDLREILKTVKPAVEFDSKFSEWAKTAEATAEGVIAYIPEPGKRRVRIKYNIHSAINSAGMVRCELRKFLMYAAN